MLTNNKTPRFSYMRRLVVLPLLAVVIVLFAFRSKEQRNLGELSVASVVASYKEDIKDVFIEKEEQQPDDFILINGNKIAAETISMKELISTPYLRGLLDERTISPGRNNVLVPELDTAAGKDPIFVVNGQRRSKVELSDLDLSSIQSIHVYKNAQAVELFGSDAANGVISITLKSASNDPGREDGNFTFPVVSGVAKDSYNNVVKGRKIIANLIVYQGEEKSRVYEEVVETKSDENGNFSVRVGSGTKDPSSKNLSQVDPGRGPLYLNMKVAIPPSTPAAWWQPSQNYIDLGFSELTVKDNRQETAANRVVVRGYPTRPNPNLESGQRNSVMVTDTVGNVTWKTTGGSEKKGLEEVVVSGYATPVARQTAAQPARFPGGDLAWEKYLARNLDNDILRKNHAAPGKYTVVVSFLVDKEGNISDVHAENDPGYGTKAEAERIILNSPRWVPGTNERGKAVLFRQRQTVSFISEDVKATGGIIKPANSVKGSIVAMSMPMPINGALSGGVFSGTLSASTAVQPSFPGGLQNWNKYLERNMKPEELIAKGAPAGRYSVIVTFTVDVDGSIRDVRAENDPGFGAKDQAIRLITKSPAWAPASVDGRPVSMRHWVSITFSIGSSIVDAGKARAKDYNMSFNNHKGKDITLSPNTTALVVLDIPDVKKGDPILVTPLADNKNWSVYSAWVSEENEVSIRFNNYTNKEVKVSGADYRVVAMR